MDGTLQDLRFAARTLARTPGFTVVATLVLALGVGVNTGIFSVVNAVVLRPLPYPDPDRLVEIHLPAPGGVPRGPVSVIDFEDWRERSRVFEGMALVNTLSRGLTLAGDAEPEQLVTAYVHPAFFPTLGVEPERGRALRLDENVPGRDAVVVISHRLWTRRIGGDPAAAGRAVTLDGRPFTIAGVMPAGFRFPDAATDVWAPESLIDASRAPRQRDTRYQRVIARLRRGVSLERAESEMDAIAARLAAEHPDTNAGRATVTIVPLREAIVGDSVRTALLVLLGAVAFVLLIACVNVGNLLFARTEARRREIAVRLSLGAGRLRVVRQLLTESLVLALAGGVLGLALGTWSLDGLVRLSGSFLPAQNDVVVDRHVLGFALLVSLLSAALFGCVPAIRAVRSDPQRALGDGGRGLSAGPRGRRLRSALVVAETSLALVLVAGAGLMIRSLDRLLRVDPGFEPGGVLTVSMNASSTRYPERAGYVAFYREVLERVRRIPSVNAAGATRNLPLRGTPETWPVIVEGRPPVAPGSEPLVAVHPIGADYFRAMGTPLLQGRTFTDSDHDAAPAVAIVSRALQRRFWPDESPVGRDLHYGPRRVTIVGVVGDVRQARLDAEGQAAIYVPQAQDPRALAATVRREIQAVDPAHPIIQVAPMEDVLGDAVARPRLMTILLASFAGLALGLAALGLYGVVAYTVSLRTREFGVRVALGATPRDVAAIVLREGGGMALAGVAIGTAAAAGLTRFLSSQLYEVGATDATTFVSVAGLLLATGLAASWIPARRATRVDPMTALRIE